jgi:hypothetical protein
MQHNLKRTHATSLSDDELILLDVIFDGPAPLRMLRQSMFWDYWNRQPHNLDDHQLRDTLDLFCEARILVSELFTWRNETRPCYGLTPHGGELWESERTPVWDRYATDRYLCGPESSGRQTMSICALSANIRDDFWQIGGKTGMWSSDVGRVRFWQISRHVLIPWKSFPRIFVAIAKIRECHECDWALYETRRTWWRTVEELQKFL